MLYGRNTELAMIDKLLDDAHSGHSGVLVVRGTAGIGKSALLARAEATAEGMRVLRATGTESESELSFAGLHLLFGGVTDRIAALPDAQANALRAALTLSPTPRGSRPLIGLAVLTLLAELAEERPLLCVVDDAHWLDAASADALLFAARRLAAESVVLLFSAREVDAPPFPAAGLAELRLPPLAPADAARMLEERAADLPGHVRAEVLVEAEGIPLALEEFSAAWRERPSRYPHGASSLPVHSRILRSFTGRIESLPPRTRRLLLVMAAEELGDAGAVLEAAEGVGCGVPDLVPAEGRHLVRIVGDRLTFRHPLIRAAAYQSASLQDRLATHSELATVFAARGDVCRHAWHLAASSTGPDEDVAGALDQAAEAERALGGYVAVAAAYERAAALSPDPKARGRRLLAAAEAAAEAGQHERAETLAHEVPALVRDPVSLARVAVIHARAADGNDRPAEANLILADAGVAVAPHDQRLADRMLFRAVEAAWAAQDFTLVARTALRAEPLGLRTPQVLARAAHELNSPRPGAMADGLSALRELVGARDGEGDGPADEARRAWWHLMLGDHRAAHGWASAAERECRTHGAIAALAHALSVLARTQLHLGLRHDALASGTEGLRIAREVGQRQAVGHLTATLAHLAAMDGDERRCATLAAEAMASGTGHAYVRAGCALVLLDLGLGNHTAALDRLDELASGPNSMDALSAVPDLVEAAVRASRPELATEPARRYAEWAEHVAQPWATGVALRCRALLDEADAERHYTAALELAMREGGRPFELARTQLLYGEWLRRARRAADARPQLRRAIEGFDRLGARPWVERARAELRATGERRASPGQAPDLLGRLTPQELQVVRLAATGLTNREIGEQLFLSPRTVGYHLYKAYPKLGISTRGQLTRLSPHEGLSP